MLRYIAQKKSMNVANMTKKGIIDKLSIYIPQKKMEAKPVKRSIWLGEKRARSIDYMVLEAIVKGKEF